MFSSFYSDLRTIISRVNSVNFEFLSLTRRKIPKITIRMNSVGMNYPKYDFLIINNSKILGIQANHVWSGSEGRVSSQIGFYIPAECVYLGLLLCFQVHSSSSQGIILSFDLEKSFYRRTRQNLTFSIMNQSFNRDITVGFWR